jgi:hypothetical protein
MMNFDILERLRIDPGSEHSASFCGTARQRLTGSSGCARSCPAAWCTSRESWFGWTRAQVTTADNRAV